MDPYKNLVISGAFSGGVDFDPGVATDLINSNGGFDGFVTKVDTSGNYIWAKNVGGTGDDVINSSVTDQSGNIYSTGYFNGTADFDPGISTLNLVSNGKWG